MKNLVSKFITFIFVAAFFAGGGYFVYEKFKQTQGEILALNQSGQQKDAILKELAAKAYAGQKECEAIKKDLDQTKIELENTKKALDTVNLEMSIANKELNIANKELQIADRVLDTANKLLEAANMQLGGIKASDNISKEPSESTPAAAPPIK